ncbi:Branched-chain-amino-acid aminotransferase [Roseimaritima multifibrata]|uniref:Branched-chain-amino-acid aminotransferase n=1 Tax=Roseimaritima multifibrata TaxID=1930274 RepID=A0A517ME09_9BACT|nr:branched-chain-amino-acid transaminase [Roseimaritima multifibrata]QDS93119.1 Branched-chain-amino-acid aminotransferase [Roseimaritima multifibrata]
MALKVFINGELFDKDDAKISVFDHGLLFGDGIFEGMRAYSGKVFEMGPHLDRLWESARAIHLEIPGTKDEMAAAVNQTLQANELSDAYVRLIVTRGTGTLGLDAHLCKNPQVIIITDKISLYPEKFYEEGLDLVTAATIRNHPAALSPRVKSLNYLNNILAKIEGARAGCVEALMLNHKGEVAECTGDNIFIVRKGKLLTPPIDAGILEGITRNAVIQLAAKLGIECLEQPFTRHDVFVCDECFLTGSAAEVIPVVRLDDRSIGDGKPGPMTQQLRKAFTALVHGS